MLTNTLCVCWLNVIEITVMMSCHIVNVFSRR